MSEIPQYAEYGTAVLAGKRIPIIDPISENNLARFQPKITSGDYTHDSDDLLSVWSQASWLGGGQAYKVNASSQAERWWDATNLDTEQRGMLSLRLKMYQHLKPDGATGSFMPLGDYKGDMYGAWGTMLAVWSGTDWIDSGFTLHGTPVARGQVYRDKLYIPLGASGLDEFDGDTSTVTKIQDATPADITAKSVLVWDKKLVVLTTTNEYRTWDDVAAWTAIDDDYAVLDGSTPRHLQDFIDAQKNPTVFIVTSRGIWAVDPVNSKLVKTGAYYPPHPTQALASAVWRNTDMYISVGVGVHQWNGDVFSAMGLDRDDGLRAELRGYITDLTPEYNGMFALVQGDSAEGEGNDLNLEGGMNYDEPLDFPVQRAVSSLWRYNGYGWHKIWESPGASGSPTWGCVSAAEDGSRYEFHWGYGDQAWRLPLRISFYNPQQGVRAGIDHFEAHGVLRTGRWNANMPIWPKLASHLDVALLEESQGTITIEYMTDQTMNDEGQPVFVPLGQVSTPGVRTRLYFGDNYIDADGSEWPTPTGIEFDWIEFRYTFDGVPGNDQTTPLADSFVFKFIKLPLSTYSWTIEIPLEFDEQYYDIGPNEMSAWLSGLAATNEFIPFLFKDTLYRVGVAQSQGRRFSGQDTKGKYSLIVLEVK